MSASLKLSFFIICLLVLSVADFARAEQNSNSQIDCPDFIENVFDEKAIIEKFKGVFEEVETKGTKLTVHQSCPDFLMKKGYFQATEYLFKEWFIKQKIDIVDYIQASVNYMKRELDRTVTLASNFKKKQK